MPWIGGAKRCWNLLMFCRRCCCCKKLHPEVQALRTRILSMDQERENLLYRLFPPRRIEHFFAFEGSIGSGGYGTVFRAQATPGGLRAIASLEDDRVYALKRVPMNPSALPEEMSRSLLGVSKERHFEVLDIIRSPGSADAHLVRMYAFVAEIPRHFWQVMELLEGPDLFDFVAQRRNTVPEAVAAGLVKQMVTAVHYMHRNVGAIHRDVKPENFGFATPVPPDGQALPPLKLFDLGLSWVLPETVTEERAHDLLTLPRAGTPLYMAPETWDNKCGPPTDVWSAGLILYLLLSLELPFGLLDCSSPMQAVQQNALRFASRCWSGVSKAALELTSSLLEKDPALRPSTAKILASPWLASPGDAPAIARAVTGPLPAKSKRVQSSALWQTAASVACL